MLLREPQPASRTVNCPFEAVTRSQQDCPLQAKRGDRVGSPESPPWEKGLHDLEAMSDEQIVPETVDHPVVKPKHPSALAALNMAMVVFGQVVDGGAVTQVDVLYQSQVAQGSQRSVDGGQVEFRVVALEALGELFGTGVSLGIVGQLGQYQPPRRRHAPAAPTQVVQ